MDNILECLSKCKLHIHVLIKQILLLIIKPRHASTLKMAVASMVNVADMHTVSKNLEPMNKTTRTWCKVNHKHSQPWLLNNRFSIHTNTKQILIINNMPNKVITHNNQQCNHNIISHKCNKHKEDTHIIIRGKCQRLNCILILSHRNGYNQMKRKHKKLKKAKIKMVKAVLKINKKDIKTSNKRQRKKNNKRTN